MVSLLHFGLKSNTTLYIFIFKLFSDWPLGALPVKSLCIYLCHTPGNVASSFESFLSTFFFFSHRTRCFRLIFRIFCPNSRIINFSMEPLFLLLPNGIDKTRCVHWVCSLVLKGHCFWAPVGWQGNELYVYFLSCVYLYI